MKKIILFLIVLTAFVGTGCDVIDEKERIIEMNEVIPLKKVLLLDFTDQACPNCPKAGIEVANLKTSYSNNFVPVTIHASSRKLPLVTKDGNTYDIYFGTRQSGHPAGVIDGALSPDYNQWGGEVLKRFNVFPSLDINLSVIYNPDSLEIQLTAKIKRLREITNPHLLLWIVENNVIERQLVDTETIPDYVHQHIFRAAINDTWGEEISLINEEEKTFNYTYLLDENWKSEDISIIGFVYDSVSDEVYDVTKIPLFQ
jgi:hypothetical protein